MGFWRILMGLMIGITAAGSLYIAGRFYKFRLIERLTKGKRAARFAVSFAVVAAILLVCLLTLGYMNAIIIMIHLMLFFAIGDLIAFIIRKVRSIPKNGFKYYYAGAAAIVFAVIYFSIGAFLAHHVWITEYDITSEKLNAPLKVALIADTHTGTTFHGEGFARHMAKLQECDPDLLIVAGDFVDDDTSKEDMLSTCATLGEFKTTYGVFYALGNHDRGYFNYRNFSGQELLWELEKNNVKILRDEAVLVNDSFYVIGRKDRSESTLSSPRMEMKELTKDLDFSKFIIVIDHQPTDYEAQAKAGVDLVLSGHTHGGQMLMLNWFMAMIGDNDMLKGLKVTDNTAFIVTSGMSDWAIKFKTGCKSEAVIVNVNGR